LIRCFHAYKTCVNPRARLLLAGSSDQFESYRDSLHALVAALGADDVHLLGQVTNEELTALYDVADLFLCASEHEGFCVPLVEAFYKRIPVVAYAAAAVPATLDGGGLVFRRHDPLDVAALMDAVLTDAVLEARVLAAQDAALERLQATDFSAAVLAAVHRAVASTRRPLPPVAPDFWHQFRLAEELDDLRDTRPSVFHALPQAPDRRGVADVGHRS
jgi:glycosyltransferase involved in cell wall biosynthesis